MLNEQDILETAEDFEWHRARLDVNFRYRHIHIGEPERYPCKIATSFKNNPSGPDTLVHSFSYQKEVKCENCGHTAVKWPNQED